MGTLQFKSGVLLFRNGLLAMSEECCDCEEDPRLPDCNSLPLTWLVSFSNMPEFPTGNSNAQSIFSCLDPKGYGPWQYCSTPAGGGGTRNYHSKFKGFCDQVNNSSWELPYVGGLQWGLTGLTFPQAILEIRGGVFNSCDDGPADMTNRGISLSASVCPNTNGGSSSVEVNVSFANVLQFTKTIPLSAGQTIFDVSPIVMTTSPTQNSNLGCSRYTLNANGDCVPTNTFVQGPTCTVVPNG